MRRPPARLLPRSVLLLFLAGMTAGQDHQATYKSAPKFVLSQEAIDAGVDGMVTAMIDVTKDGDVKKVDVLGGPAWPCESSPDAAIQRVHQAIRQNLMLARFGPALKDGRPVDASVHGEFPVGPDFRASLKEQAARKLAISAGNAPSAVDGGDVNGRAVSLPSPSYPMALRGSVGGTLRVQVLIDETGSIKSAGALRGPAALRKAARTAACRARFSPTLIAGKPVKVWGIITYRFIQ